MNRPQEDFPTRRHPYRRTSGGGLGVIIESTTSGPVHGLTAGSIYRFVLGVDQQPRPMSNDEIQNKLNDAFAVLLLRTEIFPQTLRAILQSLDAINNDPANGLPDQKSFRRGRRADSLVCRDRGRSPEFQICDFSFTKRADRNTDQHRYEL
ncbi:MAG: hypothetical protein U0936_18415 [Planctomycetaceae bacterium]